MQKNLKVILTASVLVSSLFLTSCSSDREKELSAEVDVLTQKNAEIQKRYDDFLAEILSGRQQIKNNQRDAGIAQGCDWLIAICPLSVVANGRQAIKEGYTPDPFLFWVNAILKFAVLILLINIFIFTLKYLHIKFNMPANKALIEAKEIVENASNGMRHEKAQLQAEIDALKIRAQEEIDFMCEVNNEINYKCKIHSGIEKEIQQLEVMKNVLTTSLISKI